MAFRRRAFAWAEPEHPLLQRRLSPSPGADARFRSPTAGALRSLVADHVVRERVVFPGAAYLEMARAACVAAAGACEGAALSGVFFLQPLPVDEGVAWVDCALLGGGGFEVRSGSGEATEAVHCSGQRGEAASSSWRRAGLSVVRRRCGSAADAAALYRTFASVGLQYGAAYRTVAGAWAGGGAAVAQLARRSALGGTQVHPADLDGALQSSALLSSGGGTRLPFSIDGALLRGRAAGGLWATVAGAEAVIVMLADGSDERKVWLDGFRSRKLRGHSYIQHLYETSWREAGDTSLVLSRSLLRIPSCPLKAISSGISLS